MLITKDISASIWWCTRNAWKMGDAMRSKFQCDNLQKSSEREEYRQEITDREELPKKTAATSSKGRMLEFVIPMLLDVPIMSLRIIQTTVPIKFCYAFSCILICRNCNQWNMIMCLQWKWVTHSHQWNMSSVRDNYLFQQKTSFQKFKTN